MARIASGDRIDRVIALIMPPSVEESSRTLTTNSDFAAGDDGFVLDLASGFVLDLASGFVSDS
jgi:hypothetical protein